MSGADSLFYAGLAGGRQATIEGLEADLDRYDQHVRRLDGIIGNLNQQLAQSNETAREWQQQAILKDAQMVVVNGVLKEKTGKKASEHYSEDELNKRVQSEIPNSKKSFGVTE